MKSVDRGFEFYYRNLSNRRKFIRTMWLGPFALVIPFILYFISVQNYINIIVSIFTFTAWIIQIISTYKQYKR